MATGQTINDRILAAKHSIAGQGLAKAVCKATTEELIGPKRKHLDYLLRCTEEPNVSIPNLANLLLERIQNPNWIVVFKALVTIHHLMCYGNEKFTQYLASSNTSFQLSHFLDKGGGVQERIQSAMAQAVILDPYWKAAVKNSVEQMRILGGGPISGYDMSPYVRRYAKYMSEKSGSYRAVAFDFCKIKRGKDGGQIRQMKTEKLLKTLPMLHDQLDALLGFDATTQDLNNGVINAAFMLLFRDLIRLFACYNDGIINLLEKFFEMNKKQAREALDIYKKFLLRMDRVAEFLKVAEYVGIDKGDIPDLAQAPSSLLEALEAHLATLEGRKPGSNATTPTGAAGRVNVAAAVSALSSTSSAFGANSTQIDEKMQRQLLEEEEKAMRKYKEQAASTGKAPNPFFGEEPTNGSETVNAAPAADPSILDMFGMPDTQQATPVSTASSAAPAAPPPPGPAVASTGGKASDDLLQLSGNPFASVLGTAGTTTNAQPPQQNVQPDFNFAAAGFNNGSSFSAANGSFIQQSHLQQPQPTPALFPPSAASTTTPTSPFSPPAPAGGQIMQPNQPDFFGGNILQPQGGSSANASNGSKSTDKGLVSGDLDASLANLTSNLNLSSGANKPIGVMPTKPKGPPMAAQQIGFH